MTDLSEIDHSSAPHAEPEALEQEERRSRWPTVIGVISILYAIGGFLCAIGYVGWTFASEAMMAMGGMQVAVPPVLKIQAIVFGLLMIVLGVILLTGGIGVVRRNRSGVKLLKAWVVLRITLLLIGMIATILTAPALMQFQHSMLEAQNQALREAGRPEEPIPSDDEIWRGTMINTAIFSGLFAIYPLFLGIYLSRRKITAEVETWEGRP